MSESWGGPATAPGLQRWGMLPLLFGAAGAAGGVADALASEAIIGQYGREAVTCAWIGGGIGIGIGTALSISRRWWIAVPPAVALGGAGYAAMVVVSRAVRGRFEVLSLDKLLGDEFFTLLALVAAPVLVIAHLLWLRWRWVGDSIPRSIVHYAVLGAVSGSAFWYDAAHGFRDLEEFSMGLGNGAIYGLFQYGAMRAARAMACGPAPASGGRTPS